MCMLVYILDEVDEVFWGVVDVFLFDWHGVVVEGNPIYEVVGDVV